MATHDPNINIQVLTEAPPVSRAGFGIPVVMDNALMSERIRYYTSAAAAAADVGSSGITLAQSNAIARGFAQSPRPARIGAGRILNPAAQVATITIGGTPDAGDYTFGLQIGASETRYIAFTADNTDTNNSIAQGVLDGIEADPSLMAVLTPSILNNVITLVANSPEDLFEFVDDSAPAGATIDYVVTTPGVSLGSELSAVLAENSEWYGFTLVSRDEDMILAAADWTESSNRIFVAQSSAANILSAATDDLASQLQDLAYKRTALVYHHANGQYADMAWLAMKLANDMDQSSTTWQYATLAGITVSPMSETQKRNLLGKNANVYLSFHGQGAMSDGKVASGLFIDQQVLADWTQARIEEAVAQLLLRESNFNRKVPYTDVGLTMIESVVLGVLLRGLEIGHFTRSANGTPPFVVMPKMADIPAQDRADRIVRFSFAALEAGAIGFVEGTGYILTSNQAFEALAVAAGFVEV